MAHVLASCFQRVKGTLPLLAKSKSGRNVEVCQNSTVDDHPNHNDVFELTVDIWWVIIIIYPR